ncbi:helix-turn-helix domain-containing protein [Methylotuvimicrobium buryatense]|uniref:DNA-binding protein n=1 Tax=Methylotuvimicrobium buryatense TaxID=95641 RepID=A0A4P9UKL6_METBY|nr:helix-turn-helix domain-containing protein [Methylotuvimicrobium buryatense]QCW81030.1 DNA-binding protein [Methylotuvimicrobium buryatense]
MNNLNHERLFSRSEAAIYLGVSTKTLAIWASTRRYDLPMVKIGRLAKYKKADLDAFITRRTQGGAV